MSYSRAVLTAIGAWLAIGTGLVGTSRGDERHFVMIFGSQIQPKQLRYTHTWATFVRATGQGPDLSTYDLQVHTISWLPASMVVKVWRLRPEPGVNLGLYETLGMVGTNREDVTLWGPFLTTPEIYQKSLQVRSILESGRVRYRAISTPRDLDVSDCIHAVAAVDPKFGRAHYPLVRIGKPASRFIARQVVLRAAFDESRVDASWLIPRLGLDRYPIRVVPPAAIPKRTCALCLIPE